MQSWIGNKVSSLLSEALSTQVTVGSVGMGLTGRIIIDDVTIPDQQGDTLLRVGRLAVKAELLSLLEGRIGISSAQLFGAHARLYQADSTSAANYQFLIDALSSGPDTAANRPLDLHIGSLIVRRSSVSYDRGDAFTTPGRFNPAHVAVGDISTHVMLKSLTPDSVSINVKRLTLREQSGLAVDNFTARLTAGPSAAHLCGLLLQLPRSTLAIDTLDASYALDLPTPPRITEDTGRRFMETLRYHAVISNATITPADFASLAAPTNLPPKGRLATAKAPSSGGGWGEALNALPILSLSGAVTGTGKELICHYLNVAASNEGLVLNASGDAASAPEPQQTGGGESSAWTDWHLNLGLLDVSPDMLSALKDAFPAIPDELLRIGGVRLAGKASRLHDGQTDCQATAVTGIGDASLLFAMDSHGQLSGHIATDSLHLGRLLANDDLGHTAATVTIGGTKEQVEASGTVQHILFKGHNYRDIAATASYQPQPGSVNATVAINDPDLTASAEIALSGLNSPLTSHLPPLKSHFPPLTPQPSTLKSQISIARLCPSALALTDRWGDAVFSGSVDADLSGSTLADIRGHLRLDDFTMRNAADSVLCLIDHLLVKSDIHDGQQLITLSSDIAEGELSGLLDFASLPKDFSLRLAVKDTRWMQPLLDVPLSLKPYLLLTAATEAGDNSGIAASVAWGEAPSAGSDTLRTTLGVLNAVAQLRNNDAGRPETHVNIKPSHVMIAGTPWLIHPSSLTYRDGHLDVDSFAVSNGGLHLIIDGTASASPADTLTVDMSGLDVAYIQDLLDFHPVDFSGLLSGKAFATSLFSSPTTHPSPLTTHPSPLTPFSAWADVQVDSFRFQNGRMGTLNAQMRWNTAKSQIDIDAVADDGPASRTLIDGYVSPVRSDIDLRIRAEGSSIEFCRSFTDSFLSDLSGKAHGFVELAGPLGGMNLTGLLTVDGQMTVEALNTTYTIKNDTIHLVPNDIQLHNVHIADRDGNTATLSGGIHHQELSDFTFDIGVEANGLLVYDFPAFDDSNICGTVRATGSADIRVRPGEVTINCNVTPQPGSTFAYNAANPDAVSKQEFIAWGKKAPNPSPYRGGEGSRYNALEQRPNGNETISTNGNMIGKLTTPLPSAGGAGGGASLRINFLINATPDATLRVLMDAATGDYITLNGEGTIRAAFHNKGPFHMFGTYTVSHGTYGITIQNIIKKNFTFQPRGTIVFGGDPYDATLNLQAVHTVNGVSLSDLNIGSSFASNTVRVNCIMNILGAPAKPQVDFDLELPTVNSEENQMIRSLIASEQEMNQQVLYLLGIGRFYTQGANNADAQQYGQTTLAMQSFLSGTISTQINEVLSQVIKSNDWNFGANISTGNEGWNNAEYEGMVSGRLLNNRLLINGQFGYRDRAATTTPSFIGDFDIQYLLKRNGNLAVKVYNQTNDRYFTRSALNTQGVGLVMKKDFDGLGDLLRRKNKNKKANQKIIHDNGSQ